MEVEYNLNYPINCNNVCRVCLTESTVLLSIHEINLTHNFNSQGTVTDTPLTAVLQKYCNVTVDIADNKPQKICDTCMNTLCHAFNVFELFLESNAQLDTLLQEQNELEQSIEKPDIKNEFDNIDSDQGAIATDRDSGTSAAFIVQKNGKGGNRFVILPEHKANTSKNSKFVILPQHNRAGTSKNSDISYDPDTENFDNAESDQSDEFHELDNAEPQDEFIDEHNDEPAYESEGSDFLENSMSINSDDIEDIASGIDPKHSNKSSSRYVDDKGLLRDHSYSVEKKSYRAKKLEDTNIIEEADIPEVTNRRSQRQNEPDDEIFRCRFCQIEIEGMENVFEHLNQKHIALKRCIICLKHFSRYDLVLRHLASHTAHGVACNRCQKFFKDQDSLASHRASDAHKEMVECNICHKKYMSNYRLRIHMAGMHNSGSKRNFQCNQCGLMLKWEHNLYRHMKTHQDKAAKRRYLCQFCAKSFATSSSLNCHVKKIHEGRSHMRPKILTTVKKGGPYDTTYQCEVCLKFYSSESSLFKHRLSHPELPVQCLYCDEVLKNPEKYKDHRKAEHSTFVCSLCEKGFPTNEKLICHRSAEHNPKTYSCGQCNATFEKSQLLKYHQLTHSGHRPYVCDYCGKCFKQLAHKSQHIFCVHTEKKFKCKICRKAFMFDSSIKNHMRSHTGEKPYICPYCGKASRDTTARHKHVKHDHPDRMDDFLLYKKQHQEEENKQARALCKTDDDIMSVELVEGIYEESIVDTPAEEEEKVVIIQNRVDDGGLENWSEEDSE